MQKIFYSFPTDGWLLNFMESPLALSFYLPAVLCFHSALIRMRKLYTKTRVEVDHPTSRKLAPAEPCWDLSSSRTSGWTPTTTPLGLCHPPAMRIHARFQGRSIYRAHLSKGFLAYLLFSFVFKTTATPSYTAEPPTQATRHRILGMLLHHP